VSTVYQPTITITGEVTKITPPPLVIPASKTTVYDPGIGVSGTTITVSPSAAE
jgi:hypothetical protein